MRSREMYLIDRGTVLFKPEYDGNGKLITVVMGANGPFRMSISPSKLIDQNLRYYGSSLQGALDGSRMILGEISMQPIVVNEKLDLYWFPSKSPTHVDCVWFALHNVAEYEAFSKTKTLVFLTDGSSIIIEVSEWSFDKRIQRAYKLRCKMEVRSELRMLKESNVIYRIAAKNRCSKLSGQLK